MPYVAPNVILSLDDSGSMDEEDMLNNTTSRAQVLRDALKEVFHGKTMLDIGDIAKCIHMSREHIYHLTRCSTLPFPVHETRTGQIQVSITDLARYLDSKLD